MRVNINPEVETWLENYDNPMKAVVQAVRKHILASDERVTETVKWQAPTFVYKGNIASFFPKSKKHASLMFHKGATIPGDFPSLEGEAKEARTFKVANEEELAVKANELTAIIKAWCDARD